MQASNADEQEFAQLAEKLQQTLYRFDCPDSHTLGEYQLDLLAPMQRTRIAAHAADCDDCRAELQTLRTFLDEPISAPESLLSRGRRLVATLLSPAPGLAYSGLRGSPAPAVRVYEVEDVTVTIGAGQAPGDVIGLVMVTSSPPEDLVGREVRLVPDAGPPLVGTLDDIGNFEFSESQAPPGLYTLELDLPESLVVIEALRVG